MPEPPEVSIAAQRHYDNLDPYFTEEDQLNGYNLLLFCEALVGTLLEEVRSWVSDRDNMPGWAVLLNADEAPSKALKWLSQFNGAELIEGSSDEVKRETIKHPQNLVRGRRKTILRAVQDTLEGTKVVTIKERYGFGEDHAYRLFIRTYDSQTPDEDWTRSQLEKAVPGGIRVDYESVPGQSYDQMAEKFTDYDELHEGYATYNAAAIDIPS